MIYTPYLGEPPVARRVNVMAVTTHRWSSRKEYSRCFAAKAGCLQARNRVCSCRNILLMPPEERFVMTLQTQRETLSARLDLTAGLSRKSAAERKRYFEISREELAEVDTLLGNAVGQSYSKAGELAEAGDLILGTYKMLCRLIDAP
jgi:four helix bundle protein